MHWFFDVVIKNHEESYINAIAIILIYILKDFGYFTLNNTPIFEKKKVEAISQHISSHISMHPTKEKPRITKENIVRLTMHSIQRAEGLLKIAKESVIVLMSCRLRCWRKRGGMSHCSCGRRHGDDARTNVFKFDVKRQEIRPRMDRARSVNMTTTYMSQLVNRRYVWNIPHPRGPAKLGPWRWWRGACPSSPDRPAGRGAAESSAALPSARTVSRLLRSPPSGIARSRPGPPGTASRRPPPPRPWPRRSMLFPCSTPASSCSRLLPVSA